MRKLLGEKPWILIVLGFLVLISVWTFFLVVAINNQPERLSTPLPEYPAEAVTDGAATPPWT